MHVGCSGVDFAFGVDVKVNAPARQTAIDDLDGRDLDNAMALLGIESRRFGVEDDVTHEPSVRDDPLGGRDFARIASVPILPPVALDGGLDFGNRALDLVVGQVALRALAVGERKRAIDLGLEFAQTESLGDRRGRLVG